MLAGWYVDERWCPFCKEYTQQECKDSGHERDSSGYMADCTICGASYNGYTGKYAKGKKKNIQENLMWFFQEYDYSWDTIFKATDIYLAEYFAKNYEFMRTAMYFIKKLKDGTAESELANYCDIALDDLYIPERTFKKKVV